jgi:hypothetical protein
MSPIVSRLHFQIPNRSLLIKCLFFNPFHVDFFLNFFKSGIILINGGMVSPNRNPQGFKGSIRSQMSFTMARSGMERNIPGMPHKAFPAITTIIEKSALILTFEATILGTM